MIIHTLRDERFPFFTYTCTVELYDNGELLSRTEQEYDAWGILMHEEERNPDGELLREVTVHTLEP